MYIAGTLIGGKITLYAITLIDRYTLYGCLFVESACQKLRQNVNKISGVFEVFLC